MGGWVVAGTERRGSQAARPRNEGRQAARQAGRQAGAAASPLTPCYQPPSRPGLTGSVGVDFLVLQQGVVGAVAQALPGQVAAGGGVRAILVQKSPAGEGRGWGWGW